MIGLIASAVIAALWGVIIHDFGVSVFWSTVAAILIGLFLFIVPTWGKYNE